MSSRYSLPLKAAFQFTSRLVMELVVTRTHCPFAFMATVAPASQASDSL